MNFQRVAALGSLDVERTHQRITALRVHIGMLEMAESSMVLSAGIPRLSDNRIAGLNPQHGLFMRGEHTRVVIGIDLVSGGLNGAAEEQKQCCMGDFGFEHSSSF